LSGFPIRAAFFYPWFPEAWNQQGISPFTRYSPSNGFYDSSNAATIQGQIRAMQYGQIQVGISSWWGVGHNTDLRLPLLLNGATTMGTGFRWATYYEKESLGDPSITEIQNDLTYLRNHYGSDPSYLRIGGRFVVFVYAGSGDGCGMVDRWKAANTVGAYLVMKVFAGYLSCASQPDGWHQYSPAVAEDSQQGASFSISPGFYKANEILPRLTRDLTRWNQNVRDMVASKARWQLVTTFNEWGEGTSVESAIGWASISGYGAYLDALHYNGQASVAPPTTTTTTPTTATSPATTTTTTSSTTTTSPPPTASDATVAAGGDIACDPGDGGFNGGLGTTWVCNELATSDLLLSGNYAKILTLGDHQYENNTYSAFLQSFDPSWGRLKARIAPALGNHEYLTSGAAGYYQYFGAAAHQASNGYYSYDVGAWHMIALNAECSHVGGCGAGSPQEQWLKADLAAHTNACVLAYWHQPRWSSGQHGSDAAYDVFWKDLYAANADLVLNGHDHDYERFAPQNPSGQLDTTRGIREFVVGTGGKNHYAFTTVQANSQVRNSDTYGVLQLTLHASGYDWKFIPVAGRPFTDSGSGSCH